MCRKFCDQYPCSQIVFFEKTNLLSNFSPGAACCVYIAGIGRIADLDTIAATQVRLHSQLCIGTYLHLTRYVTRIVFACSSYFPGTGYSMQQCACMLHIATQHDAPGSKLLLQLLLLLQMLLAYTQLDLPRTDRIVFAVLTAAADLDLHLIDPASRHTVDCLSRGTCGTVKLYQFSENNQQLINF